MVSYDDLAMPRTMQELGSENQSSEGPVGIEPVGEFTYDTLPNGMPILDGYPDSPSHATIFLDFDGDTGMNMAALFRRRRPDDLQRRRAGDHRRMLAAGLGLFRHV